MDKPVYKVVKVNAALNPACPEYYETVTTGIESLERANNISLGYSALHQCITHVVIDDAINCNHP